MHRDIKPDNIMLRSKNPIDCVLVDFGLATFTNVKKFLFTRCGTPGYVAPEIANFTSKKQEMYHKVCDVFSIGSLFHLLYFKITFYFKINLFF